MKFAVILMIKNESKILRRCLEAVENVVDCFCILDTGSTDNTVEIANEFLKTRTGCVTVEPWKDFGYNRTVSFQNAQKYIRDELKWDLHTTYGLLLDADMMFVPGKLRQQNLDKPGYRLIQVNGGLEYYNTRLVRMDYPWKCIGVTHEYWDGPTETMSKEIAFIDDRNDGGCKHDKYERDQRLLEKGLEDDPTNVRYMFYLAQTYKCMGKFKDSIAMYKKRIASGGWPEEVWYSHYMIGECWRNLGNVIKFEEWMQKAHAYRQCRVESIYKLAEHYRIMGQHYKAYHYTKIGLSTPYPKDDVLFIEGDVYRGKFDYEASILDYYVHQDKSIGLHDSMQYLLKLRDSSRNVISNLKFYTKPIGERYEKLNIPQVFGDEYHPSAISILEYPFANARFVNYHIQPDGSYVTPQGIVITKNAYVNLETGECISAFNEPEYLFDTHIKGLEDMRIYTMNNKTYFTATSYKQFIKDKISIVAGEYDYRNNQFCNYRGIQSPTNSECEKNWVNIPGTDNFIYSWSPLRIGKIVNDKFIYFVEKTTPPFFEHARGSAPPMKIGDRWWVLVHFVEYCVPRKYYHCFVELDENYNLLKVTHPFYFKNNAIEYCISTRIVEDNVECYVSFNDADPHRVIFSKSKLQWITIAEPVVKNTIVRVPPNLRAYWDGGYSRCLAGNSIEQYVNESINKQKLSLSTVFSCSDGFLGHDEYVRQFNCVGRDIANTSEDEYDELKNFKLQNTKVAIAALCSRKLNRSDTLLLPLDDDTFAHGLEHVLSRFNIPSWEQRKPIVFWRGGSSGYDRPSIRMKVTDILYNNPCADVRLTKWGNWENEKDIPENHFGDRCDLAKHFQYKYILIIDGNCIASNHQWVFGSGAVPIMITHPDNDYWFKKFLKPMETYVPIRYDLSDLEEKIAWLVNNDDKAREIASNALQFSRTVFTPSFQKRYIDEELVRISNLNNDTVDRGMDWIERIVSAWTGHRKFAEWITNQYKDPTIVELGVDYGYSTFVFANALKNTAGTIYGIDLFAGDVHAGFRNTYEGVMKNIKDHNVSNIEIIAGDFTEVSKTWSKPVDILHIDGLHTYEAVKNDFTCWSKFVKEDGIILFHDTAIQHFGIKDFFRELTGGHRLYFTHSAGLGIYTKNEQLYKLIRNTFKNVHDFNTKPF